MKHQGWELNNTRKKQLQTTVHERARVKSRKKCCQRKVLIRFLMVEEDNERLMIAERVPKSTNNTVK